MLKKIGKIYGETALIKLIAAGLVIGILIALYAQPLVPVVAVMGRFFVSALKGVAPILVFVLVMNAMAQNRKNAESSMRPIIELYIVAS